MNNQYLVQMLSEHSQDALNEAAAPSHLVTELWSLSHNIQSFLIFRLSLTIQTFSLKISDSFSYLWSLYSYIVTYVLLVIEINLRQRSR